MELDRVEFAILDWLLGGRRPLYNRRIMQIATDRLMETWLVDTEPWDEGTKHPACDHPLGITAYGAFVWLKNVPKFVETFELGL